MSSQAILNNVKKIPAPLFGTVGAALTFTSKKARTLPSYAPWAIPLGAGALWFVWPAVDEEWKQENGLIMPKITVLPPPQQPRLNAAEIRVLQSMKVGDYSPLEKEWEDFQQKACKPGDGDDDDDDDDDDEDDDDDDDDEDGGDDDDNEEGPESSMPDLEDDENQEDEAEEEESTDESDESEAEAEEALAQKLKEEEEKVMQDIAKGDFSTLEKNWEEFQIKACKPGDGDDDDDDEEDEDDDDDDEDEDDEDN